MVKPSVSIDNTQIFINNRFVDSISGKKIDVVDPRNESVVASIAEGDEADINIAVDAAYDAFYKGPWYNEYTPSQRGRLLNKWADLIDENVADIAVIESLDVGAPLDQMSLWMPLGSNSIRYFGMYSS